VRGPVPVRISGFISAIASVIFISYNVYSAPSGDGAARGRNDASGAVETGPLSAGLSIFPGVIVHGTGLYAAGDTVTANRLLAMEGIGLLSLAGGVAALALTGASRYVTAPLTLVSLAGAGLFVNSWLADIYGSSGGAGGGPPGGEFLSFSIGHGYIYDPQFEYRHFISLRGEFAPSMLMVSASIDRAVDDDNTRIRVPVSCRVIGDRSDNQASFIDVEGACTFHRYGTEKFRVTTGEVFINSRLDMAGIGQTLRGSFMEGGFGYGVEFYQYEIQGLEGYMDRESLLLMRFGYGLYLGRGGEVFLYYDHRKDDFAAGMGMSGIGGGILGHAGVRALYRPFPWWGLYADIQVGSAFIVTTGLMYRMGHQ